MTFITYPAGACQQRRCVVSGAAIPIPTRKELVEALEEAIKLGGGVVAFARRIGVTQQAVCRWQRQDWAPLKRALAIEAIYGIDRQHFIEPDLARALSALRAVDQTPNEGGDER